MAASSCGLRYAVAVEGVLLVCDFFLPAVNASVHYQLEKSMTL